MWMIIFFGLIYSSIRVSFSKFRLRIYRVSIPP